MQHSMNHGHRIHSAKSDRSLAEVRDLKYAGRVQSSEPGQ